MKETDLVTQHRGQCRGSELLPENMSSEYTFSFEMCQQCLFLKTKLCESQEKFLIILWQNPRSQLLSLCGARIPILHICKGSMCCARPRLLSIRNSVASIAVHWKMEGPEEASPGGGRGEFGWQHLEKFVLVKPWKYQQKGQNECGSETCLLDVCECVYWLSVVELLTLFTKLVVKKHNIKFIIVTILSV